MANKLTRYIPFIRGRQQVSRREALGARPVRNSFVRWERSDEGEVTIFIPMRKDRMSKVLSRVFKIPDRDKRVVLDEVGSAVWEMCDGKNDIDSIVLAISRGYKLARREAEVSVTTFFKMLAERKLIGLAAGGGKVGGRKP